MTGLSGNSNSGICLIPTPVHWQMPLFVIFSTRSMRNIIEHKEEADKTSSFIHAETPFVLTMFTRLMYNL